MAFEIKDRVVKISKDCKTCEHIKVCRFHYKMSDLCKSNEFYQMNEFLEWNNSLRVFEEHSGCQYFKLNYKIPEDGSLNLTIDKSIIEAVVMEERPEGLSSWEVQLQRDNVIFNFQKNKSINVKITDLLSKYSFNKKDG